MPRQARAAGAVNVQIEPAERIKGRLTAPADKSISHRAAILAAMADEPVLVTNYLEAEDTLSTLAAIEQLGALVERRADGLMIRGVGLRNAQQPAKPIDVGNAGTLLRLEVIGNQHRFVSHRGEDRHAMRDRLVSRSGQPPLNPLGRIDLNVHSTGSPSLSRH